MALETEKWMGERERKRVRTVSQETDRGLRISTLTMLDTGCLLGDCIFKEMDDKLNATHLVVLQTNVDRFNHR